MSWWLSASMLSRCSDMLKLVNIFPLFHVQDHVDFWNKPHQYAQQKLISFSYLAWIQVHQQGFSHLYVNSHQQTSGEPWFGAPWGLILECPYHFPGQTKGNPIFASWNGFFKTLMSIVWVETEAKVVLSDWRVACHIQIASCRTKGLGPS